MRIKTDFLEYILLKSHMLGITELVNVVCIFTFLLYHLVFHKITVSVENCSQTFMSAKSSVAEVLRQKQIVIQKGDLVIPRLPTKITTDLEIKIIRSFPITIKVLGKKRVYYTIPQPVRVVLQQAQISFLENDRIVPGLDTMVKPNQSISITRITSKTIIQSVILKPGPKDYQYNSKHPIEVWQWFKIIYEDGIEAKRVLLKERFHRAPLSIAVSVRNRFDSKPVAAVFSRYTLVSLKVMEATAYYPGPECTGKYAVYGLTYTGKKARYGLVAVDPRVIPLGTMLYIEGYGLAEAADIGGAIKGDKIDLCFNTYREAKEFGRKKIKVCVLGKNLQ
jgi:3D (Asp-Asp-Asp) domain-containing protein